MLQASYPGDIGMHVIKWLWCYDNFHRGEEPADPLTAAAGWARFMPKPDARLNYRKEVVDFLHLWPRTTRSSSPRSTGC